MNSIPILEEGAQGALSTERSRSQDQHRGASRDEREPTFDKAPPVALRHQADDADCGHAKAGEHSRLDGEHRQAERHSNEEQPSTIDRDFFA